MLQFLGRKGQSWRLSETGKSVALRRWKGIRYLVLITILLMGLTACGSVEEKDKTPEEYWVLQKDVQESLLLDEALSGRLLSSQYYQGELIQFWSVEEIGENGKKRIDIYLCRESGVQELLFQNVSKEFCGNWFLDNAGCFYILYGEYITRVDRTGNLFFKQQVANGTLTDICQLSDGQVFVMKTDAEEQTKLLKLDMGTGSLEALDYIALTEGYAQAISADEGGFLWLSREGIQRIDTANGAKTKVVDFASFEYEPEMFLADFRVNGENDVEIVYSGEVEHIKMVDIGATRTIITLRCEMFYNKEFMEQCIVDFNRDSETYYVVAEVCGEGEDLGTFLSRTDVEIATGKGPDIVFENAVTDSASLLEKGAFADLRPFMEASGVKEEDYFSAAFDFWKNEEGIFAANMVARPTGLWISEELLGSSQTPDIETLVNALLDYKEESVFQTSWESDQVLEYFLAGSESLWGMVDWEKDTCDFGTDLFAKMLEAAKRYGYDSSKELPYVAYPLMPTFYSYETKEELLQSGRIPVGYIFEEGCYQCLNHTGVMAINNNSDEAHKQGAWEFMAYLLGDEVQTSIGQSPYPVKISAFEANAKREMEEGSIVLKVGADGRTSKKFKAGSIKDYNNDEAAYRAANDLKQEVVDEVRELLVTSKALPTRATPLIGIINEEASAYFNGSKSVQEVVAVIENRVQLYLDEN